VDKKIPISIAVAIAATVVVYLGLEGSLFFPTFFSAPITSQEAVSIVAHTLIQLENILAKPTLR